MSNKRCIIEMVIGYSIIASLFFILPDLKELWIIAIFAYMPWLARATGPQDPDKKYTFKFAAFGNKGMGATTKYMGVVISSLVFISIITAGLFAYIICYLVSILFPSLVGELLFLDIGIPVFGLSSILLYRYYDRYLGWGEKLNLFFIKRFLNKLWKLNVKSLASEEADFLRINININEPLGMNLFNTVLQAERWKNRVIIEKILNNSLSESLLSKYIIQQIPPQENVGDYYIMKWAEDYIKLHPEVLN